jgi:hypothetical protein
MIYFIYVQNDGDWTNPGAILGLYYGRLLWLFPSQVLV